MEPGGHTPVIQTTRLLPVYALVAILVCTFMVETGVMLVLEQLPGFAAWQSILLDGTLLTILLFPVLYHLLFLPLRRQLRASLAVQQQAENSLRLAAKVFEYASEAIVITDLHGAIIDVNQAYVQITGFEREEVLGANPKIGKSGRHGPEFYQTMWAAILTQGQWSGEVWDRRKNGEIYPKWLTIHTVRDGAG